MSKFRALGLTLAIVMIATLGVAPEVAAETPDVLVGAAELGASDGSPVLPASNEVVGGLPEVETPAPPAPAPAPPLTASVEPTTAAPPAPTPLQVVAAALNTTLGEAVIGFAPGRLPAVARGGRLAGLPVAQVSQRGRFVVVQVPTLDAVHAAIGGMPGVTYVEDNKVARATVTPNDPRFGSQYGPTMMGFPTAWGTAGYGSSGIRVSVIDSGIRSTHEDFVDGRVLAGRDYSNNDAIPNDDCGHGTHTAGTVGATTNNAKGVAGMSQVTILPMKALKSGGLFGGCSGTHAQIAQAIIDSADQGAA